MRGRGLTRIVFAAAVVLLVGALANWLVAIRYASLEPSFGELSELDEVTIASLLDRAAINLGPDDVIVDAWKAQQRGMLRRIVTVNDEEAFTYRGNDAWEVGWPLQSFTYMVVFEVDYGQRWAQDSHVNIWQADTNNILWRLRLGAIPYGVRPVVFAVNSLLYAVFAGLVWIGTRQLFRRTRLDRGVCPTCRYDLRKLSRHPHIRCPECGITLDPQLLQRPKQLLRWWMLPLSLPMLALMALVWTDHIDSMWVRMELAQRAQSLSLPNMLILAGFTAWIGIMAWMTYEDRPVRSRIVCTLIVTATVASLCIIPTLLVMGWNAAR